MVNFDSETPEEKARRIGVPVIPKRPRTNKSNPTNPTVSVCGECGIEIKQIMHYSCRNSDCPLSKISY